MRRLALLADWKRGLAAPFLFVGLALAAYGSREGSPGAWSAALASIALAAHLLGPAAAAWAVSPLSVAVVGFAAWLAISNVAFNPSYNAAAQYHAALLVAGFALGRRAAGDAAVLLRPALLVACGLAAWAVWQRAQGMVRPSAVFETPATLAAVLNLCLLPAIVCAMSSRPSRWLLAAALLMATAVFLTLSRGGWLGLAAGALVAVLAARWLGVQLVAPRLAFVVALPALGILAILIGPAVLSMTGDDAVRSSAARLGLYGLALDALSLRTLLVGDGYLAFYYLLEAGRADIPTYEQANTFFVHNDYLQVLRELGIPGLAGLLAMVLAPIVLVWRHRSTLDGTARGVSVAVLASLATMAVHACVDYPFYIPVCLVLYGAGLGLLDATLASVSSKAGPTLPMAQRSAMRRGLTAAAGTLAAWVLVAPLGAQAAAQHAARQWAAGHAQSAAYWFEAARVIEPRDWRYHWQAGEFWLVQAEVGQRRAAADLADRAFAAGFSANPREARNLLGRVALHRRLGALLTDPAPVSTQISWAEEAVRLLPHDPGAHDERERVLEQGRPRK